MSYPGHLEFYTNDRKESHRKAFLRRKGGKHRNLSRLLPAKIITDPWQGAI